MRRCLSHPRAMFFKARDFAGVFSLLPAFTQQHSFHSAVGPMPATVVRYMALGYRALSHERPRCRQQRLSQITRSLSRHL